MNGAVSAKDQLEASAMKEYGKKVWIFPDAELPPEGVNVIPGHESIIITNVTDEMTTVTITLVYENRELVSFPVTEPDASVVCARAARLISATVHR